MKDSPIRDQNVNVYNSSTTTNSQVDFPIVKDSNTSIVLKKNPNDFLKKKLKDIWSVFDLSSDVISLIEQ
jgi:hypothetical protein